MDIDDRKKEGIKKTIEAAYEVFLDSIESGKQLEGATKRIMEGFCDYATRETLARWGLQIVKGQESMEEQNPEEERRGAMYEQIKQKILSGERISTEERLFIRLYSAEHNIQLVEVHEEPRKKSDEEPSR